jgi:hypothetical protein
MTEKQRPSITLKGEVLGEFSGKIIKTILGIKDQETIIIQIRKEFDEAIKPYKGNFLSEDPDYAKKLLSRPDNADVDDEF